MTKTKKICVGFLVLSLSALFLAVHADSEKEIGAAAQTASPFPADFKDRDSSKPLMKERRTGPSFRDPKIKVDMPKANPPGGLKRVAPPQKGGPTTRQAYGQVWIDNRSKYVVDVYLNGYYEGTISPNTDFLRFVDIGKLSVYCRANIINGSVKTWEWKDFVERNVRVRFALN